MSQREKICQLNIFNIDKEEKTLTWRDLLVEEKNKPYFQNILEQIAKERSEGITIYPKNSDIFNALSYTAFEDVKVVILGQDPYHGHNQAHGLCFSVQKGVPQPPSLQNIFKELNRDLGVPISQHGNLENWARQGVLLLNATLSVRAGSPQSHANLGWDTFTDKIISVLNEYKENLIFLLWGSSSQKKGSIIDLDRHRILATTHPSPLSAHRGFLGCGHFSKVNELLRGEGKDEIDWELPE